MVATRTKVALASFLSKLLVGRGRRARVRRRGIEWELDLDEGIDFAIWLFGAFEPETVRAYARLLKPGAVAVDVGANIGAHTLQLAQLLGREGKVFAFEPTDWALAKLSQNLALNPLLKQRVEVRQAFLGNEQGSTPVDPVYSSWPLGSAPDVHSLHRGRLKPAAGARRTSLDAEICGARVSLIKMDVDGNECGVLRGAARTLREDRPNIVMELAPYSLDEAGTSLAELLQLLRDAGYRLFSLSGRREVPMDARRLEREIPSGHSRNVLALPGV